MSSLVGGLFGGGGGGEPIPTATAENVKRTAKPLEQLSEQDKKNRRRQASFLTDEFDEQLRLSQTGLLGLSSR